MKIKNDRIIFEPSDVAKLSPGVVQEITMATRGRMSAEDALTNAVDALMKNARRASLARLHTSMGKVPLDRRAEVSSLLSQVNDIVHATPVPPKPTVLERVRNFFS